MGESIMNNGEQKKMIQPKHNIGDAVFDKHGHNRDLDFDTFCIIGTYYELPFQMSGYDANKGVHEEWTAGGKFYHIVRDIYGDTFELSDKYTGKRRKQFKENN